MTTFVGALRHDGITAPFVIDKAMNGAIFLTYVDQVLAPTLQPGDIVPPYSPDLNPIELAFAKLKSLLRKAEVRTITSLWDVIGKLLDLFPPEECANFFAHDGYGRSR